MGGGATCGDTVGAAATGVAGTTDCWLTVWDGELRGGRGGGGGGGGGAISVEGGGEGAANVGLLVDEMSAWIAAGEREDRGTTLPQITTDIACRYKFNVHTEAGIVIRGQAEEVPCQRGMRFEIIELRSISKPSDGGISQIKCQVGAQEAFD